MREADLRRFIDEMPISVAMLDNNLCYLAASKQYLHDLRLTDKPYIGLSHLDLFPEVPDSCREKLQRVLRGETISAKGDRLVYYGPEVWVDWAVMPWHFASGEVGGLAIFFNDVTSERLSEIKLRASEQLFRTVFDLQIQYLAVLSPDFETLHINELPLKVGDVTRDEVIGKPFCDTVWWGGLPQEQKRWPERLRHAATVAGPVISEDQYLSADGSVRTAMCSITAIKDEIGQVQFYVVQASDITERVRAERALEESERLFRETLDVQLAAVYTADAEGNITHFNQACEKLIGTTVATDARWCICPNSVNLNNHPIPKERSVLAEAMRSKTSIHGDEFKIIRPDGTAVIVAAYATPRFDRDGKVVGGVSTLIDITESKRAADLLRINEQRLAAAIEGGQMGVWECDLRTNRCIWNSKEFELIGLPVSVEPLTGEYFFEFVHCDDRDKLLERLSKTLLETDHITNEFRIVRADNGEVRWLSGVGRVVRDEHGKPIKTVGINVDITDRKEQEQRLRKIADQLAQSNRRKDDFLATLAHELRNPLAPLRNGLEIIKHSEDNTERIAETRQMMERQMALLNRLVNDLLDVARIANGKLELRKAPTKIANIVQLALETCQPLLDQSNHRLVLKIEAENEELECDTSRIAQVVSNLLNNAIRYSDRGTSIELSTRREQNSLLISVTDRGRGISKEELPRVFDMFQQGNHLQHSRNSGLGIGLSLSKSIIEMHQGTISIDSDGVGMGATATIRLPAPKLSHTENLVSPPARTSNSESRRVMIVDDNLFAARSLAIMIELDGHQTRVAEDGCEAIMVGAEFLPQVIFLDIGLPGMNGYEVADYIRKTEWGKAVNLIALSGWGQKSDIERAIHAGFDLHLTKPAEPSDIRRLLQGPLVDPSV